MNGVLGHDSALVCKAMLGREQPVNLINNI